MPPLNGQQGNDRAGWGWLSAVCGLPINLFLTSGFVVDRSLERILCRKLFSNRAPDNREYCTLRDLATKLDVHGRHCMLSYLSSLPISVLRSLDTETINFTIELMMLLYLQGVTLNMLFVQSLIPKLII